MRKVKLTAKKLADLTTTFEIYKSVKDELTSYERFANNDIKVIGYPGYLNSDCTVRNKFSFSEWVCSHNQWPVIKVEGIETISAVSNNFKRFNPTSIHLFVSQKTGYSFKWHKDNVNVFLYVIRGKKIVQVKNKTYSVGPGSGVYIPKNDLHRVFSFKDTWALSVGY
jgi:hypothetical protein